MIGTGTRNTFLVAAGCLLLTGCGPAKPSGSGAAAHPVAAATTAAAAQTAAAAPGGGGGGGMACGLITEQDATTAIGSAAGHGTSGGTAALSECIFDDGALIISMKRPGKDVYDSSRAQLPAGRFTDVPGVGDGAFETGGGKTPLITLEFYKGTTLVSILLTSSVASPEDAAIAIAKIAAAHI